MHLKSKAKRVNLEVKKKEKESCMVSIEQMCAVMADVGVPDERRKSWSAGTTVDLFGPGPNSDKCKEQMLKAESIITAAADELDSD